MFDFVSVKFQAAFLRPLHEHFLWKNLLISVIAVSFLNFNSAYIFLNMNVLVTLKVLMVFAALFPVHFAAFSAAMDGDQLWRANYKK